MKAYLLVIIILSISNVMYAISEYRLKKMIKEELNFYCNKGSMQKDAIGFALYCIKNNIDVMNISNEEYKKHKIEYDKKYYTRNGWHPTL